MSALISMVRKKIERQNVLNVVTWRMWVKVMQRKDYLKYVKLSSS